MISMTMALFNDRDRCGSALVGTLPAMISKKPCEGFQEIFLIFTTLIGLGDRGIQPSEIFRHKFWNRRLLIIDRQGETGTIVNLM
jgi:hypothetical protein